MHQKILWSPMREAYLFLYALVLVLGISYIGISSLYRDELKLDVLSNAHLKAQSRFFMDSILEMASLCLKTYGAKMCESDSFVFENNLGGYVLIEDRDGLYWANIYVERKNLRTSQVMRLHAKLPLRQTQQKEAQKKPIQGVSF